MSFLGRTELAQLKTLRRRPLSNDEMERMLDMDEFHRIQREERLVERRSPCQPDPRHA